MAIGVGDKIPAGALPDRGLGVRSSRYSMIVEDGTVTQINLEEGGGLEVSDADTILSQL